MLRVLFDHCTPRPIKRKFGREIQVIEARLEQLQEIRNSRLEWEAYQRGYDALLTVDTDFGNPEHFPEYHIPVVLLRAYPVVLTEPLSLLIPEVQRALLQGIEPGLYIWDNCQGEILFSRSLSSSSALREQRRPAPPPPRAQRD